MMPPMPIKESRRVSLPTSLMSPRLYPAGCRLSPTRFNEPIKSPTRRSLPPTPPTPRRSLPGTPRSGSPRPVSPRPHRFLPDVDEHLPASSSSSSSEHTPHHSRHRRYRYPRYQQFSLRDSIFMTADEDLHWGKAGGRSESHEGRLRSFAYKYGSVFDNGYESKDKPDDRKTGDNRRATCPEICLFPPTNRPFRHVVLRVYGEKNTGKKTLLHQLHRHASNIHDEVMIGDDDGSGKRSTFLLNGEEIRMEFLIESALETEPFSCNQPVYIILFTLDSRESFHYAQQLLSRISQTHTDRPARAILVGNKLDLKRNQVVTPIEGKCMSKIYKSSFVEISALLGMNLDILWAELIRQLEHPGETTWMERVVNRGKVFAKSCEEIVMKMITT